MTFHKMLAAILISAVPLSGCSFGGAWDKTVSKAQSLYSTYVNPPAVIDYSAVGELEVCQTALVRRMQTVEQHLTSLERYMLASDRPPTAESVAAAREKFPWLSGVAAVDAEGTVLAQEPQFSLKQLDFSLLLKKRGENDKLDRSLLGAVQDSPLGPEFMLGVPIYHDADFLGLYVVYFDVRALFGIPEPTDMVIRTPDLVLWSGGLSLAETPLEGVDWKSLLADSVSGTLTDSRGSFCWMARYLGGEPLVFAVRASEAISENKK